MANVYSYSSILSGDTKLESIFVCETRPTAASEGKRQHTAGNRGGGNGTRGPTRIVTE